MFCGLMGIALFSSLGLPGSERICRRVPDIQRCISAGTLAAFAVIGLLVTAIVILTVLQRVFSGPLNSKWTGFADLSTRERIALFPALALMFAIGIYPQFVIGVINSTAVTMLNGLRF